jgi:hypothetical protein
MEKNFPLSTLEATMNKFDKIIKSLNERKPEKRAIFMLIDNSAV